MKIQFNASYARIQLNFLRLNPINQMLVKFLDKKKKRKMFHVGWRQCIYMFTNESSISIFFFTSMSSRLLSIIDLIPAAESISTRRYVLIDMFSFFFLSVYEKKIFRFWSNNFFNSKWNEKTKINNHENHLIKLVHLKN